MPRIINVPNIEAGYIVEGTHVYAPPMGEVLMSDPRAPYYERPMGFYSEELRQRYIDSSARIAGVGGGGLTAAVMLAKEGVRDFSIADIDNVDATNVGRIPLLTPDDIGRKKVDVTAELITKHNPTATVRVYDIGVQKDNVDEFVGYAAGNSGPTICFDEIDVNSPDIALMFHRSARKFGRFVVSATDVGRGGMVTTFNPLDLDHTYERYMGSKPNATEAEFLKKVKGFQLPTIANIPINATWDTFRATMMEDAGLPTTLRSVFVATSLAMDEYEKVLTLDDDRYENPHFYPRIHAANPSAGEDFTTRLPRLRSVKRIAHALLRDKLGINPPTSYSSSSREAREVYRQGVANRALNS